jgi:hypothetical protein
MCVIRQHAGIPRAVVTAGGSEFRDQKHADDGIQGLVCVTVSLVGIDLSRKIVFVGPSRRTSGRYHLVSTAMNSLDETS